MRHIPSSNSADESKREAFAAKQILDKMEKAYLTCKSYCDSGMGDRFHQAGWQMG